jgi:hypothetical protein
MGIDVVIVDAGMPRDGVVFSFVVCVEIVARKGENCHQKSRYDQNLPQLLELDGARHCLRHKTAIKSQAKFF